MDRLAYGGKGGYAYGTIGLKKGTILYVNVGQAGAKYNGGNTGNAPDTWNGGAGSNSSGYGTSGGGSTDISAKGFTNATNWNTVNHLYSRIIVAGGGGGVGAEEQDTERGGNGGGFRGGYSWNAKGEQIAMGGQQTSSSGPINGGFGFGARETNSSTQTGGGGGGWYGGGAQNNSPDTGGGGGSGYLYMKETETSYPSGKLVDTKYYLQNAGMYMYSGFGHSNECFASSNVGTKTTCTTNVSSSAVSNYAKSGNGYARITYLGSTL